MTSGSAPPDGRLELVQGRVGVGLRVLAVVRRGVEAAVLHELQKRLVAQHQRADANLDLGRQRTPQRLEVERLGVRES